MLRVLGHSVKVIDFLSVVQGGLKHSVTVGAQVEGIAHTQGILGSDAFLDGLCPQGVNIDDHIFNILSGPDKINQLWKGPERLDCAAQLIDRHSIFMPCHRSGPAICHHTGPKYHAVYKILWLIIECLIAAGNIVFGKRIAVEGIACGES